MKDTTITCLCDNNVMLSSRLRGEHGISFLIERGTASVLFDTGQSFEVLSHNARVLEKDLSSITSLMLSHGHYDHTGGLLSLLAETGPVPVYAHPDIFASRYSQRRGVLRRIGIPFKREDLEGMGASFDLSRTAREVHPGVWLTGEVPKTTKFEAASRDLVVVSDEGEISVDPIADDQALILVLKRGLFVLLGCAHTGMINTLLHAKMVTGVEKVVGVAGGTHLGFGGEERLKETISALRSFDLEILAPSHCTGFAAASALAAEFPDRFVENCVGTEIVL